MYDLLLICYPLVDCLLAPATCGAIADDKHLTIFLRKTLLGWLNKQLIFITITFYRVFTNNLLKFL